MNAQPVQFNRAWIAARIPHQHAMCLLDQVESWSAESIHCRARSHRALDNPLRAQGRLAAVCGIEYAAQAMALHPALLALDSGIDQQQAPRGGFLVSVRGIVLHVARLDDIAADLLIEATRFSGDGNQVLYDFVLRDGERLLVAGRAAVVLDADGMI